MDDLDLDAWQTLRREQHDIVTIEQLYRRGFTKRGVEAQVWAGRWQPVHRGVYALHNGPLSPEALQMAAVLACRSGALLSHQTAGELWGMVPPADPTAPIHVTVAYGSAAVRTDGLRLHRSRAFAHIGAEGLVPPRTDRVHTLLDLAGATPGPQDATRLVHEVAVAHRVPPLLLARAVEVRRPVRHRRAIGDAVALLLEGIESLLELRYREDVEQAHGLPIGRRQEPVLVDGVYRQEDVVYDLPGGRAIVRLDGWDSHSDKLTALIDRRRTVAAALSSSTPIPYGWTEVTKLPCRTAREVEAVLRMIGWTDPSTSCPRCA